MFSSSNDEYADEILRKDPHAEKLRLEALLRPNPDYNGGASSALQARVDSSSTASSVDLLGDILDGQSVLFADGKHLTIDENRKLKVPEEFKKDTSKFFSDSALQCMNKPLPSQQKVIDEQEKVAKEEERELIKKKEKDEEAKKDEDLPRKHNDDRNGRYHPYRSGHPSRSKDSHSDHHSSSRGHRGYRQESKYNGRRSDADVKQISGSSRDRSDSRYHGSRSDYRSRKDSSYRDSHGSTGHGTREHGSSYTGSYKEHRNRRNDESKKDRNDDGRNKLFFGSLKYESKEDKSSRPKKDDKLTAAVSDVNSSKSRDRMLFTNEHIEIGESGSKAKNIKIDNIDFKLSDTSNKKYDKSVDNKIEKSHKERSMENKGSKSQKTKEKFKSLFGDDSYEEEKQQMTAVQIRKTDNKNLIKSSNKETKFCDVTSNNEDSSINSTKLAEEGTSKAVICDTGIQAIDKENSADINKENAGMKSKDKKSLYSKYQIKTKKTSPSLNCEEIPAANNHTKKEEPIDIFNTSDISNKLDFLFGSIEDITDSSNSNTPSRLLKKSSRPPPDNSSPCGQFSYSLPMYLPYDEADFDFNASNPDRSSSNYETKSTHRKSRTGDRVAAEDGSSKPDLPVFCVVPKKKIVDVKKLVLENGSSSSDVDSNCLNVAKIASKREEERMKIKQSGGNDPKLFREENSHSRQKSDQRSSKHNSSFSHNKNSKCSTTTSHQSSSLGEENKISSIKSPNRSSQSVGNCKSEHHSKSNMLQKSSKTSNNVKESTDVLGKPIHQSCDINISIEDPNTKVAIDLLNEGHHSSETKSLYKQLIYEADNSSILKEKQSSLGSDSTQLSQGASSTGKNAENNSPETKLSADMKIKSLSEINLKDSSNRKVPLDKVRYYAISMFSLLSKNCDSFD